MVIRLHNTLTGSKEDLVPREAGRVAMYVCGPTVYDDAHVGHARAYVTFDVLYRFLRRRGFEVTYARNYTDIDDKIVARAAALGIEPADLAERCIASYRADMEALGVLEPTVSPRVTGHIPEIVAMVGELIDRGHAYRRDDGVYFSVRSFPRYGALSGRRLDDLLAGARVEVDEGKRDPLDFALWKAAKPGEPAWDSPWGPGRPGWHIECSAMSLRHLGTSFDIHGGGMDLIFPHHENEIAQSECATGERFARIWMHNGFVNVNKEKMSKSLGNFFTIGQACKWVFPEALRLYLLGTHYRGPIQFEVDVGDDGGLRGFPGLVDAERRLAYGYETLRRSAECAAAAERKAPRGPGDVPEAVETAARSFEESFAGAMDDDLNAAEALGHVAVLQRTANDFVDRAKETQPPARLAAARRLAAALGEVPEMLGVLGREPAQALRAIGEGGLRRIGLSIEELAAAIARRAEARKRKEFAESDRIRAEMLERGVELMDTPTGTEWRVVA
ncbi:MAG: cysteine--tRNA ligase [Myxococcota bacterium]|nr:cysteine--tRNA ligase [Myxococcota bacterium]